MSDVLFVSPVANPAEIPPELVLLGHSMTRVQGGNKAVAEATQADAIIVDGRGDLAATRTTCQLLTAAGLNKPVLLLAAPQGLSVLNPDWGVTDFVVDGAEAAEWDARLRLLLTSSAHSTISGGAIVVDEAAYTATVGGRSLDLTYTEFELLKFLVAHPGRVLTREDLLKKVWGYDYYGGTRTVDVHVRRLRAKLGAEYDSYIGTVRNVGYRFNPQR
ncbi:DNA-binding response regulator, OmpR family, contains REC and winged-helix (wHTH) domain [Propionibacterium cyclohexanicum]|uniref:DNA-binding response regulator, OmpR family, contains REC and winged-helix (WHTH) domain n=1 Tax=Propionibacterium cyclohexanicum TaxID=64702 RepID=A0A1H9RU54_9ACTN|nr:response regulator transcription factor [Propionibacterium cyclohexanicum]SER75945.1 DNA-binding response regulator, OmpR family, contains REC and winged-helix (wHTH) domain [Propionibacterium cyclohexanicum]